MIFIFLCEFFTPALSGSLLLYSQRLQVSAGLQTLLGIQADLKNAERLGYFSHFQFLKSFFPSFWGPFLVH